MCDGALVAVTRARPGVVVATLRLPADTGFETRVVGGARSGEAWRWCARELALMQHARAAELCQSGPGDVAAGDSQAVPAEA